MEHGFLRYKHSLISYHRFGNGPKAAFCFHGYAEEGVAFQFLEKYAGHQYSFYAIDLPFHGQTEWKEPTAFTTEDLIRIIDEILDKFNNAQSVSNQQLTLFGFSLGGRVILSLYEAIPHRVERLVLLAPDGLKVNFWYWLSTQTWMGNRMFAFTMKYPGWFLLFLQSLNRLGLVNASIFKFVNFYVGDAAVRNLLYARWTSLRKLKPNLTKIKSCIRLNKTIVRLIYGRHDRIILSSVGEKFRRGIEPFSSLTIIRSGHQVLHEKHAAEIIPALLH